MQLRGEPLTREQPVKAYRSMRTIREFEECVHKDSVVGQMLGFVHPDAGTHRGHGHSIEEGAEP